TAKPGAGTGGRGKTDSPTGPTAPGLRGVKTGVPRSIGRSFAAAVPPDINEWPRLRTAATSAAPGATVRLATSRVWCPAERAAIQGQLVESSLRMGGAFPCLATLRRSVGCAYASAKPR